ncbi:MAG TPA: hypothetical protein VN851_06605 [Thermoanaerobaculia bacterium]|nr:hypothetical protein [Thermoanaerobaculia bacterium]
MTSESTVWLIAALLLGIPIGFAAIWTSVCALIAAVSGYRSLAKFRIDPTTASEGEKLPTPPVAWIGVSRYRGGILKLHASPGGLALRILRIFLFHPPIRVPWERIREDAEPGNSGPAVWLDDRVRLHVSPETFTAIRDAKTRYAG